MKTLQGWVISAPCHREEGWSNFFIFFLGSRFLHGSQKGLFLLMRKLNIHLPVFQWLTYHIHVIKSLTTLIAGLWKHSFEWPQSAIYLPYKTPVSTGSSHHPRHFMRRRCLWFIKHRHTIHKLKPLTQPLSSSVSHVDIRLQFLICLHTTITAN